MLLLTRFKEYFLVHKKISIFITLLFFATTLFLATKYHDDSGLLSTPVKKSNATDAVYGIGTVTAAQSYSIKPGVVETLSNIYVKEGDFVKKGQRLVKIDNIIYKAPFAGVINYLPSMEKENIFSQNPVLVLTDLANRYLLVTLEQQGALRVKKGQAVKINFDSIRGQNFKGIVKSVYSYNDNFLARIDVENLPPEVLPEMTADVAIVIRELKDAILIPVSALEGNIVRVKRKNKKIFQTEVKIGVVDGEMAEILSGDIQEGDQVLTRMRLEQ